MLRSETLFGKRDTPNSPSSPLSNGSPLLQTGAGGLPKVATPAERNGSSTSSTPTPPVDTSQHSTNEVGSKLIVGPNIKLKGVEISDCDTLVVEGRVEATMNSRVIQIAEMGAFTGSAEVDLAEIRGDFEGELTVRQKLVIFGTGKVSGKIRYGKLVVEEGGQLSGDVQSGGVASAPRSLSVAKAAL
ncbi:MAG: polymer-forming cytoskeletal protein, partial [Herminiimonas sp.]|nr:polymer-forming cytoskeletal protein [Herminiimonas sp.]